MKASIDVFREAKSFLSSWTQARENETEVKATAYIEEVLPPIGDELTGVRLFRRIGPKPENKPYFAPNIERARILESYAARYKHGGDKLRAQAFAEYFRERSAK